MTPYNLFLAVLLLTGCATSKQPDNPARLPVTEAEKVDLQPLAGTFALPPAVIYKTNGNYEDHVTAAYDPATRTFTYYPAPTDISVASQPMKMNNGWLLDRQGGIGPNTVFLKWTYAEYSHLKTVPTVQQLEQAIIPGARVTEVHSLDITANQAIADPASVNRLIAEKHL